MWRLVSFSALRHILVLVLFAITLNICTGNIDIPYARDISKVELTRDMGLGVNIGNTMDSIWDGDAVAGETGWGNPVITQEFIFALANHGYKTIRLPVTWAEHIGSMPNYTIETAWLNRVEEVVDWCLSQGLYVIVNLHHDGG
ncbi:MAG: glycoside hydrolase family 5 protein, partial [Treponema sp.]|nr:glycoside hydrolase family 5 protein [Treponema sp.]